jgi:uncharacterized membrane protein YphA (DoxX/SURF4 family)
MTPNDAATHAVTQNRSSLQRGRAALVGLWIAQAVLAAVFLMAGGSKLAGAASMVSMFDAIGVGQWFRYVAGIIEVTAGIALLVPSTAVFGALLASLTMAGAIVTNVFVVHVSPVPPLVLFLGAAVIVWARRHELPLSW